MKKLEEYVRSIPDFPEKGIIFRDITTVIQDPNGFHLAIDAMIEKVKDLDFDLVVGLDARGFIFGSAIAYALGKGFVPCRKKGKLPCETVCASYELEYGTAEIELHKDSIAKGQKVIIVDDLIATGGTVESLRQTGRRTWRNRGKNCISSGTRRTSRPRQTGSLRRRFCNHL